MWWIALAAATPCSEQVVEQVQQLEAALDDVQPVLTKLVPNLEATRPPRAFVSDEGRLVGLGIRADCTLPDGTEVALGKGTPAPGSGYAATKLLGAKDVLVVGTHDEARDGWDRSAYLAIVAHEWVHVHHAGTDPNASAYTGQEKLAGLFNKKPRIQKAVVKAMSAAIDAKDCDQLASVGEAYADARALFKPPQQVVFDRWTFTEGIARYLEGEFEAELRDVEPQKIWGKSCVEVSNGEFGYSLGCLLAGAVERCTPGAFDEGMKGPFPRYWSDESDGVMYE